MGHNGSAQGHMFSTTNLHPELHDSTSLSIQHVVRPCLNQGHGSEEKGGSLKPCPILVDKIKGNKITHSDAIVYQSETSRKSFLVF